MKWMLLAISVIIFLFLSSIGLIPGIGIYQPTGCSIGGCSAGCNGYKIKLSCESCSMGTVDTNSEFEKNVYTYDACTYVCIGKVISGCPGPNYE